MLRSVTLLSAALLTSQVSFLAIAQDAAQLEATQPHHIIQEENESNRFQTAFLKRQVDQTMSVGRAISSIAGHYPKEVVSIVDIALDTYPDKYREIIFAPAVVNMLYNSPIFRFTVPYVHMYMYIPVCDKNKGGKDTNSFLRQ